MPQPNFQNIPLKDVVDKGAIIMAQTVKDHNISLTIENKSQVGKVRIDPIQIEQVLINVLKNAVESIENHGQIIVTISDQKPQLVVADDGPGIALENKEMLFTPFFSTKPAGQGVGLILIREILTNHNAIFSLATDHSAGWTRFSITFR